jgi:hypothetical protein
MSAAAQLQAAIVAVLAEADGISGVASGVFDGSPARAAFPYLVIGEGVSFDWSSKSHAGREHRVVISVWDEAGRTARILALTAAAGVAIEAMDRALAGHTIAGVQFVRERLVRAPGGPWAGAVEYRVRTVAV